MGWARKTLWDDPPATPVETFLGDVVTRRIAKMATADLYSWAEVGVSGIGRALSDAQGRQDQVALREAEQGVNVLLAVVQELHRRDDAKQCDT